jgi:hypothetical protein
MQELFRGGKDRPQSSPRGVSRVACVALLVAVALIAGGWIAQFANMPGD